MSPKSNHVERERETLDKHADPRKSTELTAVGGAYNLGETALAKMDTLAVRRSRFLGKIKSKKMGERLPVMGKITHPDWNCDSVNAQQCQYN